MTSLSELTARRDRLMSWLEQSETVIEAGKAAGDDVKDAEEKWIANLRRYEQVCDQIRALQFSTVQA